MTRLILPRPLLQQPPLQARLTPGNPLSRGLIGAWLPSASGFVDASRYRNHATSRIGQPQLLAGPRNGYGAQFTPSDEWTAGSSTPAFSGAFSVALWIKFASSPTAYGQFVTRDVGGAGAATDWALFGDNQTKTVVWGRNGLYVYRAAASVADTEWHLWHLSDDGSNNHQWFLDGTAVGENYSNFSDTRAATGAVRISGRSDAYRSNAALGRFYMWARTTTAAEARALFNNEWQIFAPSPPMLWVGPQSVPGICLQADGSLLRKPSPAAADKKVYLSNTGNLIAKTAPGAGDRLVKLVGGQLVA